MALIAVGVTLGTPDTVGQVPITTSNLAADVAQAVTDTTALAALIVTAKSTATTTAAAAVTGAAAASTASNAAATASGDASTADTAVTTAQIAFDVAFGSGPNSLAALLGANVGYNSTTHQFTGVTMTGNATCSTIFFM